MTCRNNKLFSILLFASGIFLLYPLAQAQSSPIIFIWNGTDYARVYPFTDQTRANTQRVQCFKFDMASGKYVCQNGGQSITVPLAGYFCTTVDIVADAPQPPPPPPTTYGYCLGQPTNTHDFDDDMISDIAWRNTDGRHRHLAHERGQPGFGGRSLSATCRRPGRSSGSATSTATETTTCCGATPAATSPYGS